MKMNHYPLIQIKNTEVKYVLLYSYCQCYEKYCTLAGGLDVQPYFCALGCTLSCSSNDIELCILCSMSATVNNFILTLREFLHMRGLCQ